MIIEKLKKNGFLVFVGAIYLVLIFINTEKAMLSVNNSWYYIKEMLIIMPVVFLLTSLLEAWIPKKVIMSNLGEKSGFKGSLISILLGSISAGPIYAAFPICKTLIKKGASISNIVVILSTWAVIKVPMLANEAKFLSPKFMATRWVLTTIAILIMGYIVSSLVRKEDIPMEEEKIEEGAIIVKSEFCIGCGVCEKMVPEHFKIEGNKVVVINDKVTEETEEKVKNIQEKCPTKAIQAGLTYGRP